MKHCGEVLAVWGKEITGNFGGRIKKCKAELKRFRNKKGTYSRDRYKEVKKDMFIVLEQGKFSGDKN